VYIEKHIKTQLSKLQHNGTEMCAGETNTSEYLIAPDEMAFRIMKTPGYATMTAGEVIHLIK